MAKQIEDVRTLDLPSLPLPKRPRGRPPTGKAMTGAERMRKSREKRGLASVAVELPLDVVSGLERYRFGKDLTQSEVIEKVLRTQLLRSR
jgi:hypothetical protein